MMFESLPVRQLSLSPRQGFSFVFTPKFCSISRRFDTYVLYELCTATVRSKLW